MMQYILTPGILFYPNNCGFDMNDKELLRNSTSNKNLIKFVLIWSHLLACSVFVIAQENYVQKIAGTDHVIDMVFIKGGSFTMGSLESEEGRKKSESPQHIVEINDFWMGRYEITWDVYTLFLDRKIDINSLETKGLEVELDVDAVASATPAYTDMSFGMGKEGYPAICMTQYAATRFCEWLSAMTGNFYRLPTEAEWEYAARAGTSSAYSFGDDVLLLDDYAWYRSNSDQKYQKVGQKKSNSWGLYDMHGNVAEWTLDQYSSDTYSKRDSLTSNPFVKPIKTYPRVVRGGSWKDYPDRLRSAARRASSMAWKRQDPQIPKSIWWHTDADFVGFRIVRPFEPPNPKEQRTYWDQ